MKRLIEILLYSICCILVTTCSIAESEAKQFSTERQQNILSTIDPTFTEELLKLIDALHLKKYKEAKTQEVIILQTLRESSSLIGQIKNILSQENSCLNIILNNLISQHYANNILLTDSSYHYSQRLLNVIISNDNIKSCQYYYISQSIEASNDARQFTKGFLLVQYLLNKSGSNSIISTRELQFLKMKEGQFYEQFDEYNNSLRSHEVSLDLARSLPPETFQQALFYYINVLKTANRLDTINQVIAEYDSIIQKEGILSHYYRTRGYQEYVQGNFKAAIPFFRKEIKYCLANEPLKRDFLHSNYFLISRSYTEINRLDSALHYQWKSMQNRGLILTHQKFNLEFLFQEKFLNSYGSNAYYERIAHIYYKMATNSKNVRDYLVASRLYEFADKAKMLRLELSTDLETAHRYLLQGHRSNFEHMKVLMDLYRITENLQYLSQLSSLMDRNKALTILNKKISRNFADKEIPDYRERLLFNNKKNTTPYNLLLELLDDELKREGNNNLEITFSTEHITLNDVIAFCEKKHRTILEFSILENEIISLKVNADGANVFLYHADISGIEKVQNCSELTLFLAKSTHIVDELTSIDSSLTIIPDGILNNVPFILLYKMLNSPYIPSIRYANSKKTILNYVEQNDQIQENPRVFAYSYSNKKSLSQNSFNKSQIYFELPSSYLELNILRNAFPSTFTGISGYISSRKFKNITNKTWDIAHFSTHSDNDIESRFKNYLLLNNEIPIKVYSQDLHNLKSNLLYLSSCKSGVGKNIQGVRMSSISYDMLSNGNAINIISSIGSVSDKSSLDLASEFYKNLLQYQTIERSFHEAQIKQLVENQDCYAAFYKLNVES